MNFRMNKDRNLKRPGTYDYKSSDQRNKRKEFPYSIAEKRFKKDGLNSPEKQDVIKKTAEVFKMVEDVDDDIPDRSFGDYYCKACNSHMASEHIWESHVKGKRHLKNTKRKEFDDYEYVDQDPIMMPEIKKTQRPIIGLQHCCEMLHPDEKPKYQCFLCTTSIPNSKLLIEHVLGLKHRMAYLKLHDSVSYNIIIKADLKKGMIEPLVEEFIQRYQNKHGLGKMRVKVAKAKASFNSSAGPHKDDLIYKKNRNDGKNSFDEERNESISDSPDWRNSRNNYDDRRNKSPSDSPDWRRSRNTNDDRRNKSPSDSPDWRRNRNTNNDRRNKSPSDSPDRRRSRNSYSDRRNRSSSDSPDWRHSRNTYNDRRKKSLSKSPDRRRNRNTYDDVRSESRSKSPDRRYVRNSPDEVRNESKAENSNWRQMSGKEIGYQIKDKYTAELHLDKSVEKQNHFDKNEIAYSERQPLTIPLTSKVGYEESGIDLHTNSNYNLSNEVSQHQDLRDFLEKKRMLEATTKTPPNTMNNFEFLLNIIENMPNMQFLEIVSHKLQKMKDFSETELNMLKKIGNSMFSIVFEKKLHLLPPDLQKKYQIATSDNANQSPIVRTATPEQKSTTKFDFQSLMDLIKNPKRENEKPAQNQSLPHQNVSSQLDYAIAGSHQSTFTTSSSNFIPSLWQMPSTSSASSSKDLFPGIPGLILPASQETPSGGQYSYPQVPYAPKHNEWSTVQHKGNLNQY